MIDNDIVKIIQDFDDTANAPYFHAAVSHKVKQYLHNLANVTVKEDHTAIYAQYARGNANRRVIIDTHLDHPAFVSIGNQKAIAIGSIGNKEVLNVLNAQCPVPIKLYDTDGNFRSIGHINAFTFDNRLLVATYSADVVSLEDDTNLQLQFDLPFAHTSNEVHMRSADNLSVTGIAVRLLDYLSSNQIDATVEVIFTKLEEIKQISASIIARKNKTPFGRFDDNTHIFCLEAATVGTNDVVRHIAERDITYTDGPVIRIADNDLIYRHKTHDNQAEWLALHAIADQIDAYQHAPLLNNCDATSYTLFSQCPNILGITIPCQHKHNIADDGTITHEVIQAKDLQLTFDLLLQIVTYADTTIQPHPKAIISTTSYATPEDTLASKRKDWMRTSVAAVPRLQMSKLYPNTPYDKLRIGIASISARLRYRFNLI